MWQLQVNGHDPMPDGLRQENDKLKDQVTVLNQQLQEVIDMNTRWQSYNKQREEYTTQLKEKLKVMEDKLASSDRPLQLSEQQQAEIDRLILQYKHKVELTEEDKVKVSTFKIKDESRSKCFIMFMDLCLWICASRRTMRSVSNSSYSYPYCTLYCCSWPMRTVN